MEVAFRRLFGAGLGAVEGAVGCGSRRVSLGELLKLAAGSPLLMREMLLVDKARAGAEFGVTYCGDRVSLSYEEQSPMGGLEPGRRPGAAVARAGLVGEQVLLESRPLVGRAVSPRLRSAGDSASAISVILRRVTGLAVRKLSPPASFHDLLHLRGHRVRACRPA